MRVVLRSVGNPDFGQDPTRELWGCEPRRVENVSNFKEASDVCLKFIRENNLGGGNWAGGDIYSGHERVGKVCYNGRIVDKDGQFINFKL